MFNVISVRGNKIVVEYYGIEIPVYIDLLEGKLVANKPKSIYMRKDIHEDMVKTVLEAYRLNGVSEQNEGTNRLR